jgi:hypothetical protein
MLLMKVCGLVHLGAGERGARQQGALAQGSAAAGPPARPPTLWQRAAGWRQRLQAGGRQSRPITSAAALALPQLFGCCSPASASAIAAPAALTRVARPATARAAARAPPRRAPAASARPARHARDRPPPPHTHTHTPGRVHHVGHHGGEAAGEELGDDGARSGPGEDLDLAGRVHDDVAQRRVARLLAQRNDLWGRGGGGRGLLHARGWGGRGWVGRTHVGCAARGGRAAPHLWFSDRRQVEHWGCSRGHPPVPSLRTPGQRASCCASQRKPGPSLCAPGRSGWRKGCRR